MSEHPWRRAARQTLTETAAFAVGVIGVLAVASTLPLPLPLHALLLALAPPTPVVAYTGAQG